MVVSEKLLGYKRKQISKEILTKEVYRSVRAVLSDMPIRLTIAAWVSLRACRVVI